MKKLRINIGNNNKINQSQIGYFNDSKKQNSKKILKWIIGIIGSIIAGIIVAIFSKFFNLK
ncbi:hypothetical protein [Companilactobacillus sp. DQM5]|uniref:hypothetical protein n=1 Tax=Companilactobacillus sp. DQM5 TaxID=3463359 RepID=UPI004058AADD